MRILIVDDLDDNVVLLENILRKAGHEDLLIAHSAQKAFEYLGIRDVAKTADIPSIDLILMDIMMPEMDGITACRIIKSKASLKDCPIIMVTAKTQSLSLKEAFDAGALDYITKPVDRIELLARVNCCLQLKQETDMRKQRDSELRVQNQELQTAMSEIKVLRGLIPICSTCKKIRDTKGFWQQLESYFQKHSDVQFSHGICEQCVQTYYRDL